MESKNMTKKYRDYFETIILEPGMSPEFPLDSLLPISGDALTRSVFTLDRDNRIYIMQPNLNGCVILDLYHDVDQCDIEEECKYIIEAFTSNMIRPENIHEYLDFKIVIDSVRSKFNFLLALK